MTGRTAFRVLSLLALLGWMAVIFWFSSQTADASSAMSGGLIERVAETITPGFADLTVEEQTAVVDAWQTVVRKAGHMTEYALLGMLAWMALSGWVDRRRMRAVIAAGGGLVYAISDELHQRFVPGRGPGVLDVFIDFAGLCIGLAVAAGVTALWRYAVQKRRKKTGEA